MAERKTTANLASDRGNQSIRGQHPVPGNALYLRHSLIMVLAEHSGSNGRERFWPGIAWG